MFFTAHQVYHIYNQGNNRIPIFYQDRNYQYFVGKMQHHLLPFVDILGYCLMPNHFHWLVWVKPEACWPSKAVKPQRKYVSKGHRLDLTHHHQQNLSHAIAIILRSYTRAINLQENRTGSLFRKQTKAKACWVPAVSTPEPATDLHFQPDHNYAYRCLQYIHNNPLKAELCVTAESWPYSSAATHASLEPDGICNLKKCEELGLL